MDTRRADALLQRHSHSVLLVHVVWATHRREAVLLPETDGRLALLLGGKTRALGCDLVASGNAADHVHVVVRYPATMCVADLVRHLKGFTSHEANRQRLAPRFTWQAGYWAESVTPAGLAPLVRYVTRQRAHHDTVSIELPEPWEALLSPLETSGEP